MLTAKEKNKMQTKTCTYQSAKIFYRTMGAGKPVVLIHGFGEDGNIWKNQVEFLKEYFFLIIPDLPGSGQSALIKDMSMEGMAEMIKALIDFELKLPLILSEVEGQGAEGVSGVCLIGHSMGGYITLAFAEKYPHLLSSFALVHSSAYADNEEKKASRLKAIEFVKKNGAYEFLKTAIPALFTQAWALQNKQVVEDLVEKSKSFTNEAIVAYYHAMINRTDRTAVLKNFNKPILFIIGQHDKAIPFEQSMPQSYLPNQAYIHILRSSAHMGMQEEADKVNEALVQFLK